MWILRLFNPKSKSGEGEISTEDIIGSFRTFTYVVLGFLIDYILTKPITEISFQVVLDAVPGAFILAIADLARRRDRDYVGFNPTNGQGQPVDNSSGSVHDLPTVLPKRSCNAGCKNKKVD